MTRARWPIVAVAGLAVAGVAWAEAPATRSIRITYDAPATCPAEAAFVGELRARTARVTLDERAGESVRVAIVGHDRHFAGELTFVEGSGRETHRRVDGRSCAEVVSALALVTALAVDPAASLAPVSSAGSASASGSSASTAAAGTSSVTGASSSAPTSPPPAPTAPTSSPPRARDRDASSGESSSPFEPSRRGWRWSIGADALGAQGVAPDLVFTVPVFLELADVTDSLVGFDVRLRLSHAGTGATAVPGGALDFTWTAGSLDVCPLAWSPGRARFVACLRGEAGVLDASGVNILPARSDSRPWLTAGLALRAQYGLVGPLFVELEPSAFAPVIRDRFYFEPSVTAFRAPAVAFEGAAGVGASF